MKVQAWFVKKTYGIVEFEIPDEKINGKTINSQKRIINSAAREQDPDQAKWGSETEVQYDGYYILG